MLSKCNYTFTPVVGALKIKTRSNEFNKSERKSRTLGVDDVVKIKYLTPNNISVHRNSKK